MDLRMQRLALIGARGQLRRMQHRQALEQSTLRDTIAVLEAEERTVAETYERRAENIAAVTAELHGDVRYQAFYETHGASFGGFPGIWRYCIEVADAFTRVEVEIAGNPDAWLDAVTEFVELLLSSSETRCIHGDEVEAVARQAWHAAT